jgi:DNA (cytosine-5)-methyltransferase 1
LKNEIAAIDPTRSRGLESLLPLDLVVDRRFGDFFNGLLARGGEGRPAREQIQGWARMHEAVGDTTNPANPSGDFKTFVEFFAGVGLVHAGLAPSGWRCVYANDIDPKKQEMYQALFPAADYFHRMDVRETAEVAARIDGRPALATASFPCVDLSLAGRYQGFKGEHSSTFFAFADVLEALGERRPPMVLIENVAGFLTSHKGADFARAALELSRFGYWLDAFVVDAAHFTPQSRPRVFLVGVAAELRPFARTRPAAGLFGEECSPSPLRPAAVVELRRRVRLETGWIEFDLPPPPRRGCALADVLDQGSDQEWWGEEEVRRHFDMTSPAHRRQVQALLDSGASWVGTGFRRVRSGRVRLEVRFDGLAGCLRTPRGGSARQIVLLADSGELRMRWMSPVEYARLQGVPDFPLVGTKTQQLWGFADAVCVPVVAWIDRHILTPAYEQAARAGRLHAYAGQS